MIPHTITYHGIYIILQMNFMMMIIIIGIGSRLPSVANALDDLDTEAKDVLAEVVEMVPELDPVSPDM